MNIDLIIKVSKSLEAILERNFHASGRGLHEKISSVESQLPSNLISTLRFIATIRNKAVHENNFVLSDEEMRIFFARAQDCEAQLSNFNNPSFDSPHQGTKRACNEKRAISISSGGQSVILQAIKCVCGDSVSIDSNSCSCGNCYFDADHYHYTIQKGFLYNTTKIVRNTWDEITLTHANQAEFMRFVRNEQSVVGLRCTRCNYVYFVGCCCRCNRAYYIETFFGRPPASWCFISTAVCDAKGLPDDCEELNLLRKFRDQRLLTTSHGLALVAEYYKIAPTICSLLDKKLNSVALYTHIYDLFLHGIVENIRSGADVESVVNRYIAMVDFCKRLTMPQQ